VLGAFWEGRLPLSIERKVMEDESKSLKTRTLKSILIKILFLFIIFSVFIIVLEIVFRTTHLFGARISWVEPDSVIGYRFSPGKKYWHNKENDHPITGRINSYGWRDKQWSHDKPAGTYRVAVLGDSMVAAFEVESDRTFLALAEERLKSSWDINVELMNFGRFGFTQTEELIVLKNEIKHFSPDMVLLFFLPVNDIQEVSRETSPYMLRPFYDVSESGELILDTSFLDEPEFKIKCFLNSFKQHSALISLVCERYNAYKKRKRLKANFTSESLATEEWLRELIAESCLSLCTDSPNKAYVRNFQLNKTLIKAMSEYCKEEGMEFVLVTLDIQAYVPEVENQLKLVDSTFNSNFFEDHLKDFAESIDIEHLGLQRIFRQSFVDTGVHLHWGKDWKSWGHWNYEGHEVVAEALTNKLKAFSPLNDAGSVR
jgi:hypothetical protein